MAIRNYNNQNLHDRVIRQAVTQLDTAGHEIFINCYEDRNAWIGENVPDIIMVTKGTSNVKFIIEVETADSVNINEATTQWKKFATEISASFYILVPNTHRNIAVTLCKQVGISARIGTYNVDIFGTITAISYE